MMKNKFYSEESIDKNIDWFYNFIKENIKTISFPSTKKKIALEMLNLTVQCLCLDLDSILIFKNLPKGLNGLAYLNNKLSEIVLNKIKIISSNYALMFNIIIHETLHAYTRIQNKIATKNGDWEKYKYTINYANINKYGICHSFQYYLLSPNELFSREKSWEILKYVVSKIKDKSKNESNKKLVDWVQKLEKDMIENFNNHTKQITQAKRSFQFSPNLDESLIQFHQTANTTSTLNQVNALSKDDKLGKIQLYKKLLYNPSFIESSKIYFNTDCFKSLITNDDIGEKITLETFIKYNDYNVLGHKKYKELLLNCIKNKPLNYPLWIKLMGEGNFFSALADKYTKREILDKIPTELVSKNALKKIDETIKIKKEFEEFYNNL